MHLNLPGVGVLQGVVQRLLSDLVKLSLDDGRQPFLPFNVQLGLDATASLYGVQPHLESDGQPASFQKRRAKLVD